MRCCSWGGRASCSASSRRARTCPKPRPPCRFREGFTMTREVLGIIWFALVGVLLAGYAVFDGFDLGVGTLFPFLGKSDEDKAVMRSAVGPVWDGNEVWLLTG